MFLFLTIVYMNMLPNDLFIWMLRTKSKWKYKRDGHRGFVVLEYHDGDRRLKKNLI